MSSQSLDKSAAFTPSADVVSCELDGGAALLDLSASTYFKLNSTASLVWTCLEARPHTLDDLIGAVTKEFDVEPERCAADLETVLSSFLEAGLVEQKDAAKVA